MINKKNQNITILTLILLTWRIWRASNNASRWQMGFNSAFKELKCPLTLILLMWRIWWAPNNASRWQMGFNPAFEGLKCPLTLILLMWRIWWAPNNTSKWQMGLNSAFKGLRYNLLIFGPKGNLPLPSPPPSPSSRPGRGYCSCFFRWSFSNIFLCANRWSTCFNLYYVFVLLKCCGSVNIKIP